MLLWASSPGSPIFSTFFSCNVEKIGEPGDEANAVVRGVHVGADTVRSIWTYAVHGKVPHPVYVLAIALPSRGWTNQIKSTLLSDYRSK